jgi:pyridoxamine 5'-phosphate oxidase family protein
MVTFSEAELEYLGSQRLGRLATLPRDGYPQNNPVGFFWNPELGTIDIGGYKMGASRKFANVLAHPKATLVVDDLASVRPWRVRGIEIRADVEALVDVDPPVASMSREIIRLWPVRIRSWGLEEAAG